MASDRNTAELLTKRRLKTVSGGGWGSNPEKLEFWIPEKLFGPDFKLARFSGDREAHKIFRVMSCKVHRS